jgi:hypothetical protein
MRKQGLFIFILFPAMISFSWNVMNLIGLNYDYIMALVKYDEFDWSKLWVKLLVYDKFDWSE